MQFVSGVLGISDGFITNQQEITEDNDGRFTSGYANGLIDLTEALSKATGRQLSQMASFRVSYLSIGLRNVNDTLDNDNGLIVGGDIKWYAPHKKTINMLQELRGYLKDHYAMLNPRKALWESADKNYMGMRFGWDSNTKPHGVSTDGGSNAFTSNGLNMAEAIIRYNLATGGSALSEGYDIDNNFGRALWDFRTPEMPQKMTFTSSFQNSIKGDSDKGETPSGSKEFIYQAQYPSQAIKVVGGLLAIDLTHCNTDTSGIFEDEYEIIVNIGIDGWEEF